MATKPPLHVPGIAYAALSLSILALILCVGFIIVLWKRVAVLEHRFNEIDGDIPIQHRPKQKSGKKRKYKVKPANGYDEGRTSEYASAPESIILDEIVQVENRERSASLHGKSMFLYQIYRTAQNYFSDNGQRDAGAASVEEIAIKSIGPVDNLRSSSINRAYSSRPHSHPIHDSTIETRQQMYVHRKIDACGGELSISGVRLSIPKDALTEGTDISLGLSWNEQKRPGERGQAVLSPVIVYEANDGVQFLKPIHLSFPHCAMSALNDWTIRLLKNENEASSSPLWTNLTLEDYEERNVTNSRITLLTSNLSRAYCCVGESKTVKVASKLMNVVAYTFCKDGGKTVNIKLYCVNDYSKCVKFDGADDTADMISDSSCERISVFGDENDICVTICKLSPTSEVIGSLSKVVSFADVWHDVASSCDFEILVNGTDARMMCEFEVYQNCHEESKYTLPVSHPITKGTNSVV